MKKYLVVLAISFLWISCNNDDDLVPTTAIPEGEGTVELQSEVNEFIWRGMNHWYFWQEDQPDLADDRFADTDEFNTYLNGFDSAEDLFENLVYQRNVVDDFSWYIPDVEAQLNSFNGITTSYGIRLANNLIRVNDATDDIVIYIGYVTKDSPADIAGLKRGDIIYQVDGIRMTTGNSDDSPINRIFRQENITLELANIVNGELEPIAGEINITAAEITSNPVQHFEVLEEGGKKIGYLAYTSFTSTFHSELNEVFALFQSENIDELVLDMRYNGGGSVLTSAYLASMINGNAVANQDIFARLQYNAKRDADNGSTFPFFSTQTVFGKTTEDPTTTESINRLNNLTRLFVITSTRTASASEMIINGLRPYMPVTIIGETTTGKNEGSITVVDAPANGGGEPFNDRNNRNSNHTVGLQPIVFQIFNSNNESDYADGFLPDVLVEELRFAADIKAFGDPDEALLRATLDIISGATAKSSIILPNMEMSGMKDKIKFPRFSNEMYLLGNEFTFEK